MGLCQSEEERKQRSNSRQIDKTLTDAHEVEVKIVKLLLLGTGECGKSTLIKQMRILHANGFTFEELRLQRSGVYNNIVRAMDEMLRAMHELHIAFEDPRRVEDARVVEAALDSGEHYDRFANELSGALKRLWGDGGVHGEAYSRRMEFHLHESAKYFFDNLERISAPDYCPTPEDFLMSRVRTSGISEVDFLIKGSQLRVVDVGGQRSERKKWIHCFEKVNAVIYISAVSEYDQSLAEDADTNRLMESMGLFDSICNSRWFITASMILFLNKKDVFAEKILSIPITTCFADYKGAQNYDECIAYIKASFERMNKNSKKSVYVHQTCATDTNQVESILDSVISMILQQSMQRSGFT